MRQCRLNWKMFRIVIQKVPKPYYIIFHSRLMQERKLRFLGRSGTGKSTLLKLLTGALQPTTGNVLIARRKSESKLYYATSISILNQKSHLFNTTVGNNIRIGRPDATDKEISKL